MLFVVGYLTNDSIFPLKKLLTDYCSISDYWSVNKWKQFNIDSLAKYPIMNKPVLVASM